ncbi:MAG TPA: RteC domain-containing protein [Puia sp.]|jgi:hypothetical protein|nr:RteC domain-containing protein [Puia sp.]
MMKPFDALYADLEKSLKLAGGSQPGPDVYLRGIGTIREKIAKLRAQGARVIQNVGAKEREFFRDVWPPFHAKWLLYIRLYEMELGRRSMPADAWPTVIAMEEKRVEGFFRRNRAFWLYYRSGGPAIVEQFSRAYSQGRIFHPLAMIMDPEWVTLASWRAAWCLAMQSYGEWLREERAVMSVGAVSAADLGYSWAASDANLAEWLFALQAVGAVHYMGQPADIGRLQKWARVALGREVANIYDRGRVLRKRKKDQLAFITRTTVALQRKWNQAKGDIE